MLEEVDEDASRSPIRSRPDRLTATSAPVVGRCGPRSRSSTPLQVRTTTLGVRSRLTAGRRMQSRRGRRPRNMRWTHGAIVCVDGDRKWTLRTTTVTMIDSDTSTIVKSRYLPMSGTTNDVGGMMSASSRKNTVNESRIDIHSAIFSPLLNTCVHWTNISISYLFLSYFFYMFLANKYMWTNIQSWVFVCLWVNLSVIPIISAPLRSTPQTMYILNQHDLGKALV